LLDAPSIFAATLTLGHLTHGLTSYSGDSGDITAEELSSYVRMVEGGTLKLVLGPTFPFESLVEAHRAMDANSAYGKMVVVV
jgi:NADPH:quinone reductase-like Zn-dependent oxidoreductase